MGCRNVDEFMHILAVILFLPFFCWGLYTLHRRFYYHEDLSWAIEGATLSFLLLFYFVEIRGLRLLHAGHFVLYIFNLLGLFVAGIALYGHVAISFTSRILVDAVLASHDTAPDQPRMGPAEMLERQKEYAAAIQEYLVLARIYPRRPEIHRRIAENYLRLNEPQEAIPYFKRALKYSPKNEQQLPTLNRLCEVYEHHLGVPEQAHALLLEMLRKNVDTAYAEMLQRRLEHLESVAMPTVHSEQLQALDETTLEDETESREILPPASVFQVEPVIEALTPEIEEEEVHPTTESFEIAPMDAPLSVEESEITVEEGAGHEQVQLEPIDAPFSLEQEEESGVEKESKNRRFQVEPIDMPFAQDEEEEKQVSGNESLRESLRLEPIDTSISQDDEENEEEEPPSDSPPSSSTLSPL